MPLIHSNSLQFGFTSNRLLFENVDLSIESGQAVVLTGPNGTGKSTLLNLLAGTLRPSSGQVTLGGYPAHTFNGRRFRWHMTSRPALFRLLTVREQLEFYAASHGKDVSKALKLVRDLVQEDVSNQLCAQLSSGQAQKVWFAATLAVHQAPILLLDEPFSAIDIDSVPLMVEMLESERRSGRSLLLVTHVYQDHLPKLWRKIDIRSFS